MPIDLNTVPESFRNKIDAKDRKGLGIRTTEETERMIEADNERELQSQIRQYLNQREIVYINPSMNKKSELPEGWSDFTLAYRGVPLAFECKVSTDQTPEQNHMELAMTRNGWRYYIIRNLSEVRAILTAIEVGYGC